MNTATGVERGCGLRISGGIYVESRLSDEGEPIEFFLCDPTVPLDVEALGITAIGVHHLEVGDTTHIADWIGSTHYPNVADFVEETRRFGLSRRVPKTFDFSRLSRASRHLCIHERAFITNHDTLYQEGPWRCPKHLPAHEWQMVPWGDQVFKNAPDLCCAGLWWRDVQGDESILGEVFTRTMPAFHYQAFYPTIKTYHQPAIFLALPISSIAIIMDPEEGSHVATYEMVREQTTLPVLLEEE